MFPLLQHLQTPICRPDSTSLLTAPVCSRIWLECIFSRTVPDVSGSLRLGLFVFIPNRPLISHTTGTEIDHPGECMPRKNAT